MTTHDIDITKALINLPNRFTHTCLVETLLKSGIEYSDGIEIQLESLGFYRSHRNWCKPEYVVNKYCTNLNNNNNKGK